MSIQISQEKAATAGAAILVAAVVAGLWPTDNTCTRSSWVICGHPWDTQATLEQGEVAVDEAAEDTSIADCHVEILQLCGDQPSVTIPGPIDGQKVAKLRSWSIEKPEGAYSVTRVRPSKTSSYWPCHCAKGPACEVWINGAWEPAPRRVVFDQAARGADCLPAQCEEPAQMGAPGWSFPEACNQ